MTAQVQAQADYRSAGSSSGRSRRRRNRWLRRLMRMIGYLFASMVAFIGFTIALVGVTSGQRSDDPGDAWAGLIIGAVFIFFAVIWFVWLIGKKRRRH